MIEKLKFWKRKKNSGKLTEPIKEPTIKCYFCLKEISLFEALENEGMCSLCCSKHREDAVKQAFVEKKPIPIEREKVEFT